MQSRLQNQNLRQLASLTALGAGALAAGAIPANAGIVVIPSGATIGYAGGSLTIANLALPGGASFNLHTFAASSEVDLAQANGYFRLRNSGGMALGFAAGATFGAGSSTVAGIVAFHGGFTYFDATDKYFLFRFKDASSGNALRYGWGELSISVTGVLPDVTLAQYAYEDTGARIAAGDVGSASVPEPASIALTGLGALALGARGIRRWRAARSNEHANANR